VSSAAALVGSQGLQALINDNNSMHITDDSPSAEPRYRMRFYFDPNSIAMVSGDVHFIFNGFVGTSTTVLTMQFRKSGTDYQVLARLLDDAGVWTNTGWITISDAAHSIELDWRAASGVGVNDGGLTLWIDGGINGNAGMPQANVTGIDNDTLRMDRVRLGAVSGVDNGTRGTYFFDAFESRRQTYIGP
jgi:hypothetical protein